MEKFSIMIMADTRGAGLDYRIRDLLQNDHQEIAAKIKVTVRSMGRARLENILTKMDLRFPNPPRYDMIYVFAGVNNLTSKTNQGQVEPVFDNIPDLIESLTNGFTALKLNLNQRCEKIIISQIVGIDMDTYNENSDQGRWYYQQNELNDAMPILAHTVNLFNLAENVIGPWITGTVHGYINHKLYHRYAKLKDGLHPSDHTKNVWEKKLKDSIVKNSYNFLDI